MAERDIREDPKSERIKELELLIGEKEDKIKKLIEQGEATFDELEKSKATIKKQQEELDRRLYRINQMQEQQERLVNLSDCKIAELEGDLEDAAKDRQILLARATGAENRAEQAERKVRKLEKLNAVMLDLIPD